jgi:spore germination cell wall hydrolase CwlJ-like protein
MRKIFLIAIATMILGLGTLYTTAKASSETVTELTPNLTIVVPEQKPVNWVLDSAVPTSAPNDEFNALVKQHEAEIRQREVSCLADNIYFEARGESKAGKIGVGEVTINRVKAGTFSDSICGVVHQHEHEWHRQPIGCQFSWYCDASHKIHEHEIYDAALKLAEDLYDNYYIVANWPDITNGALYFHTRAADQGPLRGKRVTARIDDHVFCNLVAKL